MKIDGIDRVFCINLERRPDRRNLAKQEFEKINLDFDFFPGVDGHLLEAKGKIKNGAIGCVLSHLELFKHIKSLEGEVFMITEDDVVFGPSFIENYRNYSQRVPKDWHLLYFGGNHTNSVLNIIDRNVHRLQNTYTTHCYLVKKSCIDILISEIDTDDIFNHEADVHLASIQKKFPCYGFTPALAWQRDGFSDIEMKNVDYKHLKR